MSLPPTPNIIERRRSRRSIYSVASDIRPPIVDFEIHRTSDEKLESIKNKKVQNFYKHQNEMIDRFLEVDHVVECLQRGEDPHETSYGAVAAPPSRDRDEEEGGSGPSEPLLGTQKNMGDKRTKMWIVHLAINLSFVANIMLFAAKLFVAFYSGSMAILASAFESFLDIVSNAIIFFTVRIIRHKDFYTYPVGKSRMEPLGIVVFAVIITTSFSQVLLSSIERLADPEKVGEELDLSLSALLLLGANIGVKAILWGWCVTIKGSSSVEALAYDHENDVVFSIASTIFPLVGIWADMPWLDPVGAIILSLYIIYEWMSVLLDNIKKLTGQAATTDDIKQLTYMAYRFSHKIVEVDTVRAYYIGDRLLVEVDIVLPPNCPLQEAHDVGEALQDALEMMDNVERAYVHLDYSSQHAIEHRRALETGYGE